MDEGVNLWYLKGHSMWSMTPSTCWFPKFHEEISSDRKNALLAKGYPWDMPQHSLKFIFLSSIFHTS